MRTGSTNDRDDLQNNIMQLMALSATVEAGAVELHQIKEKDHAE